MLKSENRWVRTQTFPSTFDLEMNLLNTAIILTLVLSASHSRSSLFLAHTWSHCRPVHSLCVATSVGNWTCVHRLNLFYSKTTLFLCACASNHWKEWPENLRNTIQSDSFDDRTGGGALRISQTHTCASQLTTVVWVCECVCICVWSASTWFCNCHFSCRIVGSETERCYIKWNYNF